MATALGKVLEWTVDAMDDAAEKLDLLVPFVLAAIAATALFWGVHLLRLRLLGRSPRVQISPFAWTAVGEGDPEAAWVTSLFREELGAVSVDPLDPLPERAPGAPLVEIVEGVGQGVARKLDVGAAVGKLFRAIWPDAAYEAWGTLRPGEDGRGRISVQLVDGRRRTLLSVALDDSGWEDGARQAAMAVAGALYPRVRGRHKGPWTQWEEPVPGELILAYHDARRHEEANRLEEAMGAYHDALRRDPLNPNLRLKIAMLQERLALYLDAWVTYRAIVGREDRAAWSGPDRQARVIALYRLAILLGNGQIAGQWVKNAAGDKRAQTKRDEERDELREEILLNLKQDDLLTAELKRPARETRRGATIASASAETLLEWAREGNGCSPAARLDWLSGRLGQGASVRNSESRVHEISELLEIIGLRWLEELGAWMRFWPPTLTNREFHSWWLHRPPRQMLLRRRELSRTVLRSAEQLARIRIIGSAAGRLRRHGCSQCALLISEHCKLLGEWPFRADSRLWPRRLWPPKRWWDRQRADAWQLHYNAACVVASTLLDGSLLAASESDRIAMIAEDSEAVLPDGMTRDTIVRRAVEELEEYARRAGSGRVAAQADWVAIDDPDLAGIADEDGFRLWASHHLPIKLPERRPARSADVNRYTARIVICGAQALAASWQERAHTRGATAQDVCEWWHAERIAWKTVGDICRHYKSWHVRLNGVNALNSWLGSSSRPERIDFGHEQRVDVATAHAMDQGLFQELAELVDRRHASRTEPGEVAGNGGDETVLSWVQKQERRVREAYENGSTGPGHRGLYIHIEREEALRAARIWFQVAEALRLELDEEGISRQADERLAPIRRQLDLAEG
ncbi:MAG: hypothetical protein WD404_07250 [Solirubrobacterales bacterium]